MSSGFSYARECCNRSLHHVHAHDPRLYPFVWLLSAEWKKSRRDLRQPEQPASSWQEAYDESAGAYYYFNEETGESTWEKPEELKGVSPTVSSGGSSPATAGPAPTPSLFNLARASVAIEKRVEKEMEKEVNMIRVRPLHAEALPLP